MRGRATRRYSKEVRHRIRGHLFKKTGGAYVEGGGSLYDYRKNYNGDTVVFRGGRKEGRPECFLLLIDPDGSAVLQSLRQAPDCSMDPNGSGRSMVLAAVELARKSGAHTLTLTDNSKKYLADGESSFRLANMVFLTSGRTWYESIVDGLRPLEKAEKIEMWRQRVHTNLWGDVEARLRRLAPSFPSGLGGPTERAMDVLRRCKAMPTFFAEYEDELLNASDIGSLYGTDWTVAL